MSVKVAFARLGATIVVSAALIYGLAHAAPESPDAYVGPAGEALSTSAVPGTTESSESVALPPAAVTNTPPPGFPSVRRPPREIEVADGDPQPIDTKFGLSYTVPADWRNFSTGVAGWEGNGESITYGAIADYGRGFCPERETQRLAMAGMTGRNGTDLASAGQDAVRQADAIFKDSDSPDSVLKYADPVGFTIDGEPALRYSVDVSQIRKQVDCDFPAASFDIVTTTGFSNATVVVFMIMTGRQVDGALDDSVVDAVVDSIGRTPSERLVR